MAKRPEPFDWLGQLLYAEVPAIKQEELLPPDENQALDTSGEEVGDLGLRLRQLVTRRLQLQSASLQYQALALRTPPGRKRREYYALAQRSAMQVIALKAIFDVCVYDEFDLYGQEVAVSISSSWTVRAKET